MMRSRCNDAAADGKQERIVHEYCTPLQARDVGLEKAAIMTFIGNHVQIANPVEDVSHPREQNRDETGDRGKQERRRNGMRDDL